MAQLSTVRPDDPFLWLARFMLERSAHPDSVCMVPVGSGPLRLTDLPRPALALMLCAGFLDARDLAALDACARAFSAHAGASRTSSLTGGARAFGGGGRRAAAPRGSLTEEAARRTLAAVGAAQGRVVKRGHGESWKHALWRAERGTELAPESAPPAGSEEEMPRAAPGAVAVGGAPMVPPGADERPPTESAGAEETAPTVTAGAEARTRMGPLAAADERRLTLLSGGEAGAPTVLSSGADKALTLPAGADERVPLVSAGAEERAPA
jgi:hypothetical protein